MIRSWLFVPGDSTRKMERAFESGADALIFDWEDAVAPGNKAVARALLKDVLDVRREQNAAVFVRVNGLDTRYFEDDLRALPLGQIDGVVLPKSCGPAHIEQLSARLTESEWAAGVAPLQIVAVATENAASVLALMEFRQPVERLAGLMWGAEDLAADLAVFRNRDEKGVLRPPFQLARNLTLFAAAASGCQAIDAVNTDFRDLDGLAEECRQARLDGFTGKAAIHPSQVPVINQVFSPSEEEIVWAQRVMASLDGETGVAVLDGRMIDAPHLRTAGRIVRMLKERETD